MSIIIYFLDIMFVCKFYDLIGNIFMKMNLFLVNNISNEIWIVIYNVKIFI